MLQSILMWERFHIVLLPGTVKATMPDPGKFFN